MTTQLPARPKTVDEWIAAWAGYRVDGKGYLVPVSRKAAEEHRLTTKSAAIADVKKYDPQSKLFIGGIANANEVDRMQEVLDPRGCVTGPYSKNSVLLYQHDHDHPIGLVTSIQPEDDGVHFEGWVGDPAAGPLTPKQQEVRSLIAQRVLKAVSVGFIPHKIRMPAFDNGGNLVDPAKIEEWEMLELSVVSVPCNPSALFDLKEGPSVKRVWSFPTLGEGGRLIVKQPNSGDPKMDEMAKALDGIKASLDSIAAACNDHKDGLAALVKAIDAKGAMEPEDDQPADKPADDKPADDKPEEGKRFAAIEEKLASLTADVESLVKAIGVLVEKSA